MMRTLFLVALVIGVCAPATFAQETAKAGIYGGIQNLRFYVPAASKQDSKEETAKAGIYGGLQNLSFDSPTTEKEGVISLPPAPKSTMFSAIPSDMAKQYPQSLPLNSNAAGSRFQCPPSCPSDDYNRFEIYGGYSLLSQDFRFFRFAGTPVGGVIGGGVIGGGFFNRGIFVDNGFDFFERRDRRHLNGGDVSITVNFSRYFGVQFDFSAYRRRPDDFNLVFLNDVANNGIIDPIDNIILANISRPKLTIQNYLVGVQVKDNREEGSWARPFGHILAGASRQRLRFEDVTLISDFDNDGDFETIFFDNGDDDNNRFRRTSFALAVGGGLDLRVSDRISIRAFKFDYLPTFVRPPIFFLNLSTIPITPTTPITLPPIFVLDDRRDLVDRKTQHNFRIGAGIVVHF